MTSDSSKPEQSTGAAALASIVSPLAGVDARSLDALMAEEPGKLTDGEFDRIIAAQRSLREQWIKSEGAKDAAGPKVAAAKGAPKQKAAKGTVNINLDDLLA